MDHQLQHHESFPSDWRFVRFRCAFCGAYQFDWVSLCEFLGLGLNPGPFKECDQCGRFAVHLN